MLKCFSQFVFLYTDDDANLVFSAHLDSFLCCTGERYILVVFAIVGEEVAEVFTEEPAGETVAEPVEEQVGGSAEETAEESVAEPVEEAAEEQAEKPAEETVGEPIEFVPAVPEIDSEDISGVRIAP